MIEIGDLPLYNQDLDGNPPAAIGPLPRAGRARRTACCSCSPEYNRGIPGVLKNAIDVGSRPYGQSVFDKKPAAIVTASPGSIGGFGANHQIRQACVFLNMPVMQQPEAYLGHVTDDSFDESGCLKDGPLKDLVDGAGPCIPRLGRHDPPLAPAARRGFGARCQQAEPRNTPDHLAATSAARYAVANIGGEDAMEFTWLSRWQPQVLARAAHRRRVCCSWSMR